MFSVYFILFAIAVTSSMWFAYYGAWQGHKRHKFNERWFLLLSFAVLFTFIGFRYNVGRDFIGYWGDYKHIDSSDFGEVYSFYKYEYGYLSLLKTARFFDMGPQGTFILSTLLVLILYFNLFRKRWDLLPVSIFIFMIGISYGFAINGLRQVIAILAFMNAINSLNEKNILKRNLFFLLWMSLGTLFHNSVVFFLPIIVVQFERVLKFLNSKVLIAIAITGLILNIYGVSTELVPNAEFLGTEGYSYGANLERDNFETNESALSIGNVFRLVLILIPLGLYDKIKVKYPEMRIFFVSLAIGSAIYFLFSNNMFTQRISYYFLFSELLVYPTIYKYYSKLNKGINWWQICAVMYLALFVVSFSFFFENQMWPGATVWGIKIN